MNWKKLWLSLTTILLCAVVNAQKSEHVTWNFEAIKKTDGTVQVVATATVDKSWHIYSQFTGSNGPLPTTFTFKPNPLIQKVGKLEEKGKLEKHYDELFKTNVAYYNGKVVFTQTFKLKAKAKTSISGTVSFMLCNDEQCLPPAKLPFELKIQ